MLRQLKNDLSEHRFNHTLGVVDTAVMLAEIHHADLEICRIAALLHDCAKSMDVQQMLSIISRYSIKLFPGEAEYPALLHAPAGAALAQEKYNVADERIIRAIRYHTLGPDDMNLDEAIVFVADFIEPRRRYFEGLDYARFLAKEDIFGAVKECKRLTREYCVKTGQVPLNF
ncbi:MAG: bis(5'-nucleosyl)-tetraphosphatase (symmetrical) YqeK [Clostridiales bacterium]|nr:bis(5'-nucleosyl)-tetraphosphatase (symmetrical) YqeK [Clostridiales bacterium]